MSSRIEVYDSDGKVVINTEYGNFVFPPDQAVAVANAILHAAEACGADIKFEVDTKRHITDMQRLALIKRCQNIMRSLRGKDQTMIASQIVDTVLAGVL